MPRQWVRPIKPDELESPVPGLFSFRLQRDSEDFGRLYITLRIKQHFSPRTAPVSWTHIRSAITSDSNSPQAWDEALAAGERELLTASHTKDAVAHSLKIWRERQALLGDLRDELSDRLGESRLTDYGRAGQTDYDRAVRVLASRAKEHGYTWFQGYGWIKPVVDDPLTGLVPNLHFKLELGESAEDGYYSRIALVQQPRGPIPLYVPVMGVLLVYENDDTAHLEKRVLKKAAYSGEMKRLLDIMSAMQDTRDELSDRLGETVVSGVDNTISSLIGEAEYKGNAPIPPKEILARAKEGEHMDVEFKTTHNYNTRSYNGDSHTRQLLRAAGVPHWKEVVKPARNTSVLHIGRSREDDPHRIARTWGVDVNDLDAVEKARKKDVLRREKSQYASSLRHFIWMQHSRDEVLQFLGHFRNAIADKYGAKTDGEINTALETEAAEVERKAREYAEERLNAEARPLADEYGISVEVARILIDRKRKLARLGGGATIADVSNELKSLLGGDE